MERMNPVDQLNIFHAHLIKKRNEHELLSRPYVEYNPEAFIEISLNHEIKWTCFYEHDDTLTDEEYNRYLAWHQRYLDKFFP
jgi:hypothetical protein